MKMMRKVVMAAVAAVAWTLTAMADVPVYLDDSKDIEERVEDALLRMTLQEKINIIHAQSKFSAPGVPRLGIPELWCTDGPMGVRPEVLWDEWRQAGWTNDSCTAFPSLTALAARVRVRIEICHAPSRLAKGRASRRAPSSKRAIELTKSRRGAVL